MPAGPKQIRANASTSGVITPRSFGDQAPGSIRQAQQAAHRAWPGEVSPPARWAVGRVAGHVPVGSRAREMVEAQQIKELELARQARPPSESRPADAAYSDTPGVPQSWPLVGEVVGWKHRFVTAKPIKNARENS